MTGASKRSRRPTVHRGVELRCGMRFGDEARASGYTIVARVDEGGRCALPSTTHRRSGHGTQAWLFS